MADERFSKGADDRSRRFMGCDYWIRVIAGREMPVFAATVRQVAAVTSRVWSSSGEAARVIGMDPVMTARVIRMANSAYYKPGLRSVGVLSRAVAVIGFDALRQLCRATEVVEQVCEGFRRRQIEREAARSFLGAVFAQRLAESRYEEYPEEVFTAALLSRLGQIGFWCACRGSMLAEMEAACAAGVPPDVAEKAVLGFSLKEVTLKLAIDWNLGELLQRTLRTWEHPDVRGQCITSGANLVAVLRLGWESPQVVGLLEKLAEFVNLPHESMLRLVRGASEHARRAARNAGMPWAADIPVPGGEKAPAEEAVQASEPPTVEGHGETVVETSPVLDVNEPSVHLQINLLNEIGAILTWDADRRKVLDLAFEAVLKGVGMDRVFFARLSSDGLFLEITRSAGWRGRRPDGMIIGVQGKPNVFGRVLDVAHGLWVRPDMVESGAMELEAEAKALFETPSFFLMPIVSRGVAHGLMGADRGPSGRDLDAEAFEQFKVFCYQVALAFALGGP